MGIPRDGLTLLSLSVNNHLTHLFLAQGQLDRARAHLEEQVGVARASAGPAAAIGEAATRWHLGEVALRAGDPAGAEREIAGALEARLRLVPLDLPLALAVLARARLDLGRPAEALSDVREAASLLAATGTGGFRAAEIRLVHAEVLRATGDHEAARRVIGEARDRLLDLAGRIEEPRLRRSYLEGIEPHARTLALARELRGDEPDRG